MSVDGLKSFGIEQCRHKMATAMDTTNAMDTTITTTTSVKEQITDMTADEVIAKIDELVNVANYLKRVAKPMVRRYSKKRAKAGGDGITTKRNGFAVPVTMEARLVSFLNKNTGTEYTTESVIARTDVTAAMTQYIKSKGLQVPENRKNFTMDAELAEVFGVEENTVSNWFEMQKHMTKVITSVTKKRTVEEETTPTTLQANTAADTATSDVGASNTNQPSSSTSAAKGSAPKRIKRGV